MAADIVLEVLEGSCPYIAFKPLPESFKGKWVKLVIVPRPADVKESEMERRHRIAFEPRVIPT